MLWRFHPTVIHNQLDVLVPLLAICLGKLIGYRNREYRPSQWHLLVCTGFPVYDFLEKRGFEVLLVNAREA